MNIIVEVQCTRCNIKFLISLKKVKNFNCISCFDQPWKPVRYYSGGNKLQFLDINEAYIYDIN